MTFKQIEAVKKALPHWSSDLIPEQARQLSELSCRDMINSCLVYGSAKFGFYDCETRQFGQYAKSFIKSLGEETVIQLYNEQVKDFSEAIVEHGVYISSDDCVYNNCKWKDEK